MNKFSIFSPVLIFGLSQAQTSQTKSQSKDSLQTQTIKTVVMKKLPAMNVRKKEGKYEVVVSNTNFQKTQNAWEGMKLVPMLDINKDGEMSIFNKAAIVEINGMQSELRGKDLKNFLESLDPKSIKKLELNPNPNASYGTEVNAVINIILDQSKQNYRLGINATGGKHRKDFYGTNNINYALNGKKTQFYISYNYDNSPEYNTGNIKQKIGNKDLLSIENIDDNKEHSHQAFIDLNISPSEKDNLSFSGTLSYDKSKNNNQTFNDDFLKTTQENTVSKKLQLSQNWKHIFNENTSLKIGTYQIFSKSDSHNSATSAGQFISQDIKNTTPIYIGYADLNFKTKWGLSSVGSRYTNTDVTNNNYNFDTNSPFHYKEQVAAVYFNQSIPLGKGNLNLGIRNESSFIDYDFSDLATKESYKNKKNYSNLLYNTDYSWATQGQRMYAISFRKQIRRPNYAYLNPFAKIHNSNTLFAGDSEISPQKIYSLSLNTFKKGWGIFSEFQYMKDMAGIFFKTDGKNIIQSYRNFDNVYVYGLGTQYSHSFFNEFWTTKTTIMGSYINVKDKTYQTLAKSKPFFQFISYNTFDFGKGLQFNIEYYLQSPNNIGLMTQSAMQSLGLGLTKKINQNLSIILNTNDILRTKKKNETHIPEVYYADSMLYDTQSFGITVQWNITGKNYKKININQNQPSEVNRLGK
ncbi:outer membrane beta-barrel protein [Riemerella columbipharyngis]|uniref:Outer membrane protein beta-barrel family protein n=1 Tax=Riemerella columbipharyngis TaxID=1071918 RepID=A0A1G6YCW6_9FLAO|nr:outer membrane beta-barrel protein [Riemerella columbipharyngis]SDD87577.1 Outer membrane protein beta-barrel family protein [Riemerella columbipharyngis]